MNAYQSLTDKGRQMVDLTMLGAALMSADADGPAEMNALHYAHAVVDELVAIGKYGVIEGEVLREAMTDTIAELFVATLDAERADA